MSIQTVTSRKFNQDPSSVKRAASISPVQITERGKVSHILLSIEKYKELTDTELDIVELLRMPLHDEIECEAPKLDISSIKSVDFD